MKPTHTYSGHVTYDLTECRLHRLQNDDGSYRIVALYPKTWTKGEPRTMNGVNGKPMTICPYTVTEWEEVVLMNPA